MSFNYFFYFEPDSSSETPTVIPSGTTIIMPALTNNINPTTLEYGWFDYSNPPNSIGGNVSFLTTNVDHTGIYVYVISDLYVVTQIGSPDTTAGNKYSNYLVDIQIPNTSSLIDTSSTFLSCTNINTCIPSLSPLPSNASGLVSIPNWNVSHVTNMSNMFFSCSSFNGDISGWNTGNVTSMNGMFSSCANFNHSLNFNITKVTSINNMLDNCTSLSPTNYDAILQNFSSQIVYYNLGFSATNVQYSANGVQYRNILTNPSGDNWTITDGGEVTCFTENTFILTPSGYIPVEQLKIGDTINRRYYFII